MGNALIGLGRANEALPVLRRALDLRERIESRLDLLTETRFALARALWEPEIAPPAAPPPRPRAPIREAPEGHARTRRRRHVARRPRRASGGRAALSPHCLVRPPGPDAYRTREKTSTGSPSSSKLSGTTASRGSPGFGLRMNRDLRRRVDDGFQAEKPTSAPIDQDETEIAPGRLSKTDTTLDLRSASG